MSNLSSGRARHVPDGLILTIACVAQFMVVLDVSIVNVALPSIGRDLHYTASGLQWVVNAYVLTFAGFLLLGGRAADLFGRRRVFLLGLGLFTIASLAGGVAQDSTWLTAARAGQGIGGQAGFEMGMSFHQAKDVQQVLLALTRAALAIGTR